MRILKYFILKFSCLLLFFSCKEQYKEGQSLKRDSSFGDTSYQGFIVRAQSFDVSNDQIYVSDNGIAEIKVYSTDGEYKGSYGNPGRGPGEHSGSVRIDVTDSLIFFHDYTAYSISIFSKSFELLDSFRLEERYHNPVQATDEYLIVGYAGAPFQVKLGNEPLFYKFDYEGNVVSEFGEFPGDTSQTPAFFYRSNIDVEDDFLHVVYSFLPLYQVYDLSTDRLVYEFNFLEYNLFNDERPNADLTGLNNSNFHKKTEDLVTYFGKIDAVGNKIFINRFHHEQFIFDEFKLTEEDTLVHIFSHVYPLEEGQVNGLLDFKYLPEQDAFIVLESTTKEGFILSRYIKVNQ